MAISVFPAAVASSINANAITVASSSNPVTALLPLDPAIYTITCASATIATIDFFSSSGTLITSATTASGTIAVNLASSATRVGVFIDTGTNVVVTITKTASALTNNFSGTLDTITTTGSSTYTGTSASGLAYAMLVGGGGGGSSFNTGGNAGAGGGGAGGVAAKVVSLTGSMAVTIGAAGAAGNSSNGTNGGSSTFAGMTVGGGLAATTEVGGAGGTATGGTFNNAAVPGTNGFQSNGPWAGHGGSPISPYPFITTSIGVGGRGYENYPINPIAASGYGAGGGGSKVGIAGTPGRQGVLYVLKF
jgi:hypothetical protein